MTLVLGVAAALILLSLVLSSLIQIKRQGSLGLSTAQILRVDLRDSPGLALLVVMLVLPQACPILWPGGSLAEWLARPYALLVFYAWAFIGCLFLNLAVHGLGALKRRH